MPAPIVGSGSIQACRGRLWTQDSRRDKKRAQEGVASLPRTQSSRRQGVNKGSEVPGAGPRCREDAAEVKVGSRVKDVAGMATGQQDGEGAEKFGARELPPGGNLQKHREGFDEGELGTCSNPEVGEQVDEGETVYGSVSGGGTNGPVQFTRGTS